MEPLKLVKIALDSTIPLINKGMSPTDALEKVARNLDLNPNYIQRAGEALNVALHHKHFKVASDRSDDFTIADIPRVTKSIFGEKEASDHQKVAHWFPTVDEVVNYDKLINSENMHKTAQEAKTSSQNYDSYEISFKGQYKKAVEYLQRLDKEIDALETEKVANDIYIEAVFNSLVNGFKKSAEARSAFHNFETESLREFGKAASPYLDLIYDGAGLTESRGAHRPNKIASENCPETRSLNSLLLAVKKAAELNVEMQESKEYVRLAKASMKEANYKLAGGAEAVPTVKEACDTLAGEIDEVLEKSAGPVAKSIVEQLFERYRTAGDSKKTPTFTNTKHDNADRVSMLQDLIMTDPILAHQDPKKILNAYQQILRLAPHLAKEKEVVRSLLRQLTATQSLAPVEANQLVEANTNLLKQHELMHKTDDKKK